MSFARFSLSLAGLLLLLVFGLPSTLWADGKVFRAVDVAEDPWIPDQRALLHWMDGRETLVIETSARGGGKDLAWVVPLPAPPEVEEAPTELFPELAAFFGPKMVTESSWWLLTPLAAVFLWLCRRVGEPGTHPVTRVLFGVIVGVLMLVAFFGLSFGRIMTGGSGGVEILGVQNAGMFQATTLRSGSAAELSGWLNDNGYHMPPETLPAVEAYVRESWVFVAMKIREGVRPESGALHPVTFRFPAEKPVYPMRLTATGTAGKPLALDLFILGPESAAVAGMEIKRGGWLKEMRSRSFQEVSRWFGGASFGTWLRGELPVSRLTEDVYPVWNGADVHEPVVTTRKGAAVAALNRAVPVLAGGLLIFLAARRVRGSQRRLLESTGVFVCGAAVAWGAAHFAILEKVKAHRWRSASEARADRTAGLIQREIFRFVEAEVADLTNKSENSSPMSVLTAAALKAEMEERLEPKLATAFAGEEPVNVWPALVFQNREYGVEVWYHLDSSRRARLAVWDREGRLDESPGRAIPW